MAGQIRLVEQCSPSWELAPKGNVRLLPALLLVATGLVLLQGACTSGRLTYGQDVLSSRQQEISLDLGGGVRMALVVVPGTGEMKSWGRGDTDAASGTARAKKAAKSFYIGKYEVTQRQWTQIMKQDPSFHVGADLPVDNVSWLGCVEFCDRISACTGRNVRLPFRTEWLHAYRLGVMADSVEVAASWEPAAPAALGVAETIGGCGGPQAVGRGSPNRLGIYDMEGNVTEWCCDAIVDDSGSNSQADAGQGFDFVSRCVEGGSWSVTSWSLSTHPVRLSPDLGAIDRGFRVVIAERDDFRVRARIDDPVANERVPFISMFSHCAQPFALRPTDPSKTVHGMTIRLVQSDPKTKQATVSVLFRGENKTLTAGEGHYFGDNEALFLEKVDSDGVKIVRHFASYEYEAKK